MQLFQDTLRALSLALDFDEGLKLHHAWRVALLSVRVAEHSGLCLPEVLYTAGLLHDLGGLGLSDHLVHHARRGFTDEDARGHAHRGARILEPFLPFTACIEPIRDHHERFDGRGFPLGKSGTDVAVSAYILHLADHLDVVLRSLPPKERVTVARQECHTASGTLVSEEVANAFCDLFDAWPEGVDILYDDARLEEELKSLDVSDPPMSGLSTTEAFSQLLWILARVVDTKHAYTMGHSVRVAHHAWRISRALKSTRLNPWDVVWSALLHDIGKVAVPRTLLNKQARLSFSEWEIMKSHARHSMELISQIRDLKHLAYPAAAHHERYAGGGYPLGKAREDIPLIGRILAFADAYDAMISDRGYNIALTHEQALESIRANVGTQFDPRLAPLAMRVLDEWAATPDKLLHDMGGFTDFFHQEEVSFLSLVRETDTTSSVLDTEDGPVLLHAHSWHVIRVDESFRVLEGKDELICSLLNFNSDNFLDFLDVRDHPALKKAFGKLRVSGHEGLFVGSASGLPLEVLLLGANLCEGSVTVLFRSAEEEVHSAGQLAMVYTNFSAGTDATAFLDPGFVVLDVNHRFGEVTGWKRNNLLGRPLEVVLSRDQVEKLLEKQEFSGEIPFVRADGSRMETDTTLMRLQDATGRHTGYMLRVVDITERKMQEARLRALTEELEIKNRELVGLNRLKSDLLAITSHDLKSPLASIITQAQFLQDFPDSGREKLQRGLSRIVESGEKLLRFIQDLLDVEKMDSGTFVFEPSTEDLIPLIREAVETAILASPGLDISFESESDSLPVHMDSRRLLQVLHNLLGNAVKFSPPGGRIRVTCDTSGDRICVSVEDEGPGIPSNQLESIFDRYHQVRHPGGDARGFSGAGLGLFIASSILKLHQGRVWAENRPVGGSRFRFELPLLPCSGALGTRAEGESKCVHPKEPA